MSYYQLPDAARLLIERLRIDAHNETGGLGLYVRELLADYDRQTAQPAEPSRRSVLLASTASGQVMIGVRASREHVAELVRAGLGTYIRESVTKAPTGFEVNQLGRFVARLLREL